MNTINTQFTDPYAARAAADAAIASENTEAFMEVTVNWAKNDVHGAEEYLNGVQSSLLNRVTYDYKFASGAPYNANASWPGQLSQAGINIGTLSHIAEATHSLDLLTDTTQVVIDRERTTFAGKTFYASALLSHADGPQEANDASFQVFQSHEAARTLGTMDGGRRSAWLQQLAHSGSAQDGAMLAQVAMACGFPVNDPEWVLPLRQQPPYLNEVLSIVQTSGMPVSAQNAFFAALAHGVSQHEGFRDLQWDSVSTGSMKFVLTGVATQEGGAYALQEMLASSRSGRQQAIPVSEALAAHGTAENKKDFLLSAEHIGGGVPRIDQAFVNILRSMPDADVADLYGQRAAHGQRHPALQAAVAVAHADKLATGSTSQNAAENGRALAKLALENGPVGALGDPSYYDNVSEERVLPPNYLNSALSAVKNSSSPVTTEAFFATLAKDITTYGGLNGMTIREVGSDQTQTLLRGLAGAGDDGGDALAIIARQIADSPHYVALITQEVTAEGASTKAKIGFMYGLERPANLGWLDKAEPTELPVRQIIGDVIKTIGAYEASSMRYTSSSERPVMNEFAEQARKSYYSGGGGE